jgi:uncharacterized protein (DUF2249 family)
MLINANTTIAAIIKQHPKALEAIISINPKFEKLRNPLLRKLMAGRTSIAMASKMANGAPEDFFTKLAPLGFEIERYTAEQAEKKALPLFLKNIKPGGVTVFDVTPILASGKDPLKDILGQIKSLKPGNVLKIVNTFEPTPLILLLEKQGFETYVDTIANDLVETYFYKKADNVTEVSPQPKPGISEDWEQVMKRFEGRLQQVDVRHLEMPQPMLTILAALDTLPPGHALFVHHKRIPVFLLPELNDRGFDYRVKEQSDNEVYLLLFKS